MFGIKDVQWDIKRFLNNPANITKSQIIKAYPWVDYIIQPKADGVRVILINYNNRCYKVTEKNIEQL